MTFADPAQQAASAPRRAHPFYFAAWRWHFYAGLYVIPFLVMLATTGLIMLWIGVLAGRDGERIAVVPTGPALAISAQAGSAVAAVPDGTLVQYIAPRADDRAALFRVDAGNEAVMVAVNPYDGTVLAEMPRRAGWYDFVNDIHGSLLLGVTGDRMIEIAASLAMVLVATGLYLSWPRGTGLARVLVPDLRARGRSLWKTLHASIGVWISVLLVLFLLSGLAWTGIWGDRLMQAWSTFPAEKFDAPLSDDVHASMNHGATEEVPWALEKTPMPASGSAAGTSGMAGPVTIDSVAAFARTLGFDRRFQLNAPSGDTGVWTISRDSMSNDSANPTSDRTVHVDRYSGRILADVAFADYSAGGKAMAVGIALHEGDMGPVSVAVNTLFCLSVIFLSVSGTVMWWMRRPRGAARLAAPPMPRDMPASQGAALFGLAISLAFPMAGLTILVLMALDWALLSRVPFLRRALS